VPLPETPVLLEKFGLGECNMVKPGVQSNSSANFVRLISQVSVRQKNIDGIVIRKNRGRRFDKVS
jgi:hypothetical protein